MITAWLCLLKIPKSILMMNLLISKSGKNRKIEPSKQNKIRKRSYSKEDVKVGLISGIDSGTISPEYMISDEGEYQIEHEEVINEGKNTVYFGRSLTFPSYWNKHAYKGLKKNNTSSPTKETHNTLNTWFSSNQPSDWDCVNTHLLKHWNFKKNLNESCNNKTIIHKNLHLKSKNFTEERNVDMTEREQYQYALKILMNKISNMGEEIQKLQENSQHKDNLLAIYQQKYKKALKQNLTLCSKFFKTIQTVKEWNIQQENEYNQQLSEVSQLSQENFQLRKLLKLRKESEEAQDLLMRENENKIEETKISKEEEERESVASLYGNSNLNPFNKKKDIKQKSIRKIMSSKEMLKNEIKNRHKKLKRSRATSFHFGSETPSSTDEQFEGFDWMMQDDSKTPLIPKKSSQMFTFKIASSLDEQKDEKAKE